MSEPPWQSSVTRENNASSPRPSGFVHGNMTLLSSANGVKLATPLARAWRKPYQMLPISTLRR